MAKILLRVFRLRQQRFNVQPLVSPTNVNLRTERTFIFNFKIDKKFNFHDILLWLQHDYKLSWQEFRCYMFGKQRRKAAELMLAEFSETESESEFVTFIMTRGGYVKFYNDDVWYTKLEKGGSPLTTKQLEPLYAEGVDVTNIEYPKVWIEKMCSPELRYFKIHDSVEFDDWCMLTLLELCPNIEAIDISGCTGVTDNGLEILHQARNLRVLNVARCTGIKFAEALSTYLLDFCPELLVLGIDTIQDNDHSSHISAHEQGHSRYLNWGLIMDHHLGLQNTLNLEKFETKTITDDTEKRLPD
ncbi:ATP synthase subunit s-like protein [Mactra antiquata]